MLAPLEDVGLVDEVDLRTGGIVSQLPAPGYPHGVSALGTGDVLVGQERGGKVSLFTSSNSLTASVDFPQPGGSAVSGNDLYVVDVAAWTLTQLDRGLPRGASVPAGTGPTHAVADLRGDVVVADTRGGAVLVFTSDLKQRLRVDLPGRPYGIAYDAIRDRVWVTLTARNEVVSLQGPDYRESGRWSTVQQPNTVAVDEGTGTVVVASRTEGSLQVLDVPTQRAG